MMIFVHLIHNKCHPKSHHIPNDIEGHFTHMRLRARDHYTSSTLIGGKGGAGPSSLHTTLEGPTEYVNAMQDGCKVYMDSYMASSGSWSLGLD